MREYANLAGSFQRKKLKLFGQEPIFKVNTEALRDLAVLWGRTQGVRTLPPSGAKLTWRFGRTNLFPRGLGGQRYMQPQSESE